MSMAIRLCATYSLCLNKQGENHDNASDSLMSNQIFTCEGTEGLKICRDRQLQKAYALCNIRR